MTINTIYPMDIDEDDGGPFWLHWLDEELGTAALCVDVAKGPLLEDTTERTYLTGLDAPRWTTLDLATSADNQGAALEGAYPYITYLLGVPAPTEAATLTLQIDTPEPGEIELVNPGAESGSTSGWTVRTGDLGVKVNGDVAGLDAEEGTHFFYGGNNASGDSTQTLVLTDVGIIALQSLTLTWQQATGVNGSQATVGIEFLDDGGIKIGEAFLDASAPSTALTWEPRTLTTQTLPDTNAIRLVQRYVNVGGAETDAYIDDIALSTSGGGNSWDGSSLSDWVVFQDGTKATLSVSGDRGLPVPSFKFTGKDSHLSGMYRDMAMSRTASMTLDFDLWADRSGDDDDVPIAVLFGASDKGEGTAVVLGFEDYEDTGIKTYSAWASGAVTSTPVAGGYSDAQWMHFSATLTKTDDSKFTVDYLLVNSSTNATVLSGTATFPIIGDYLGLKGQNKRGHTGETYIDNIVVEQTLIDDGSTDSTIELTNYVWVWKNSVGEISAPAPVSRSVQLTDNTQVLVLTSTDVPAGYDIDRKELYRSVYDGETTQYKFVTELPAGTADYLDALQDADLGDPLESDNWDVPPDDLRGLLALPNGIMAGFRQSKNELCVSVQNQPHAWPVDWRLATDYPIVAIGSIDTDIVVATQAHPYIVIGSDPSTLTMSKFEKPQGCVSKRSLVALDGVGVIYASPDGLTAVNRSGVNVITKQFFTRDQWQALVPESIHAVAHDGRYFFWYDNGTDQLGYIFDPTADGFGLVELNFWCSAAYSNPINDQLYMVINDELCLWDGGDLTPYRWRSKQYQLMHPASFECAQIRAADYDSLTLKLYADDSATPYFTKTVTSALEFVLPDVVCQKNFEFELSGTSRVQRIEIAESMEELG